jgi:hypothetical protein
LSKSLTPESPLRDSASPCKIKKKVIYFQDTMHRVSIPILKRKNRRIARNDQTRVRPKHSRQTLNSVALCLASRTHGIMIRSRWFGQPLAISNITLSKTAHRDPDSAAHYLNSLGIPLKSGWKPPWPWSSCIFACKAVTWVMAVSAASESSNRTHLAHGCSGLWLPSVWTPRNSSLVSPVRVGYPQKALSSQGKIFQMSLQF